MAEETRTIKIDFYLLLYLIFVRNGFIEDNIRSIDLELTNADLEEIESRLSGIQIQGERLNRDLLDWSEE